MSHLISVTVSPGPNHIDVDLDTTFHFVADPRSDFSVDVIPDPTFDADCFFSSNFDVKLVYGPLRL